MKEDPCDRMRRQHADAKYWAQEFRHPDNIQRELDRAKRLESESFFNCSNSKRISSFPK